MANGIYKVINNVIEMMHEFLPEEIKTSTFIPLTQDQEYDIVDNTIIVSLTQARYGRTGLHASDLYREFDLNFAAKFYTLNSSAVAQEWAFTVLEGIAFYLSVPENKISTYLNQEESLTYDGPIEIFVNTAQNKFSSDAEFNITLQGSITIDRGVPLEKITKSLYDEIHGFVEDHTVE